MSTGPRTEIGKATSSKNAVKHGLLAGKYLPIEEKDALEKLVSDLTEEYQPATATQFLMIERIGMAMTKLRRLHVIEDALHASARAHASAMKKSGAVESRWIPEDLVEAVAVPPLEVWSLVGRYQTSLSRQISKSVGELLVLKGTVAVSVEAPE